MQDAPYRATVLDPIGKFNSYLPEVRNAIQKREKKVRRQFLLHLLSKSELMMGRLFDGSSYWITTLLERKPVNWVRKIQIP